MGLRDGENSGRELGRSCSRHCRLSPPARQLQAPLRTNAGPGPLNLCQFPLTSAGGPAALLFIAQRRSSLSSVCASERRVHPPLKGPHLGKLAAQHGVGSLPPIAPLALRLASLSGQPPPPALPPSPFPASPGSRQPAALLLTALARGSRVSGRTQPLASWDPCP